jgi:bifunctional non-homologous end joining protein LigD
MLASLADVPLDDPALIYEPKYDGVRAIVEIDGPSVRLWSRLGNEKTRQFPDIVSALLDWARRRRISAPLTLDGEIVALDEHGDPAGFQQLQSRIHRAEETGASGPAAFMAFDLLRHGDTDYQPRPLTERRAALEALFGRARQKFVRLGESVRGDGRAIYRRALERGWEGLVAKHATSRYQSGRRSPNWRKVKIVHEQEFVVGGWTDPRHSRSHFGALLLGVYDAGGAQGARGPSLVYVGHTGTGFDQKELARLFALLKPIETTACPFRQPPKGNERPHWVVPTLVVQVKFSEWTEDGILRHPVYLGLRDDKRPEDVRREMVSPLHGSAASGVTSASTSLEPTLDPTSSGLLDQLHELERARRDGVIHLPGDHRLNVTNLHKVFWPKTALTKGDLFRYYVQAASCILPVVHDRPLTMKRVPNGVTGPTFYQHRAPDTVPAGVRVAPVPGESDVPSRFIGGDVPTLLYMTQLAAISQDPWFSRLSTTEQADHVAFDLDPADGVPFARVLDVARWIHDELDEIGVAGFPKTSGADGVHIYIPLPPATSYEAGLLFCQIVATVVAEKHPAVATVERKVKARGQTVYVDYLQNIRGKTLASAYSARASDYAGVSAPLTWREVEVGVRREDFTIQTMPDRLRAVGDLWKAMRTAKGADLSRVFRYARKKR